MPKDRSNSSDDTTKGKKRAASEDAPEATVKKPKAEGASTDIERNEEGDPFISIDKMRRVTVRKFKDKVLVDFREYYTDRASGESKPGKKGISLSAEQWAAVKANMGAIDEMLDEVEKK